MRRKNHRVPLPLGDLLDGFAERDAGVIDVAGGDLVTVDGGEHLVRRGGCGVGRCVLREGGGDEEGRQGRRTKRALDHHGVLRWGPALV